MSAPENSPLRIAAFIDVDGTLLTVQSARLYVDFLRRKRLLSAGDLARVLWAAVRYRLGLMNMRKLGEMSARLIRGRSEAQAVAHCREWYANELRRHFRSEMLDRIEAHRKRGDVLVLLTGSTRHITGLIASELGIEHMLVTELEVEGGRFTGRALGPVCFGGGKVTKAESFAIDHAIDLTSSYFYSDSIADLPMFEKVGNPYVVDPDPRLGNEAQRRGWPSLPAGRAAAVI